MSNPLTLVKLRKLIASISLTALVASLLVVPTVTQAHWADPFRAELGDPTQEARYADSMNKCEFSAMLTRAFDLEQEVVENDFTDVPEWCEPYVGAMMANNIAEGRNSTTFGAADAMPRGEAFVMVARALGLEDGTVPSAHESEFVGMEWAMGAAGALYAEGIVTGDDTTGNFRPFDSMNRAEGFALAGRAAGIEGEEPPVVTGEVSVDASGTPAGADLPKGATAVEVAKWNFHGGDKGATISKLEVSRYGVALLPSDLELFLYDETGRLTSSKSLNSSTNLAVFQNLSINVPAGGTKTVTLKMNTGTVTTTGSVGFQLESASAVTTGGTVTGSFPVKGNSFFLTTTPAGTITMTKNGTLTDAQVGAKGATVAKFKLAAATEGAELQEVGLYVSGTVNTADMSNFKLYASTDATPLAEVSAVDGSDVIRFNLSTPYEIEKGATRQFHVTADFNTGRTGDTVLVYLDETADLVAIGDKYNYGMSVTATAYDGSTCTAATPTECSAMTLEGGDITISGNTLTNRKLGINQDDAKVLEFTITSQTDATFDNFVLGLTAATQESTSTDAGLWKDSDDSANFTDITVSEVDGSFAWGPVDSDVFDSDLSGTNIVDGTDAAIAYYVFTDDLVLSAGESRTFEVTVDVANNAALANETLVASVYIDSTYPTLKDVNNKTLTNSSSLVPTSTYTGSTYTVTTNEFTVVRSEQVGSKTVVIGAQNETVAAFSVGASESSDTTFSSIKLSGYIDGDNSGAFVKGVDTTYFNEVVLSMRLYEGSVAEANLIGSAASANTSGEATFNNLDWTVPAGQTKSLIVTANFANNSSYGSDEVKVDLADVSADITAEDAAGNTVSTSSSDTPNGGVTDSTSLYTQITLSSGGSLAADVATNTIASQIVVAGTDDNEFGTLKFTATDESFVINEVTLRNEYTSTAGDYDDNLSQVKLRYFTDAAQTEEEVATCSAATTTGYYTCNVNVHVPDPDLVGTPDYAEVDIIADLNGVANDQADETDKPQLTLALLADFEATAQGSGTKVTENSLSLTDVALASFSDAVTSYASLNADGAVTAAATTIVVDDGADADAGDVNIAGSIACLDDNNDQDCDSGEEQVYVVSVADGTPTADEDTWTVVRGVNGTTAAALTNGDSILLQTDATVLATNYQQVQATDIETTVASSTKTGSQSDTEDVLTFTLTANAAKEAKLRQGSLMAAATAEIGGGTLTSEASPSVDGAADKLVLSAAGDAVVYDAGAGFTDSYDRMSFWVYTDDAGTQAIDLTAWKVSAHTTSDALGDNIDTLANLDANSQSAVGSTTDNVWRFVDIALPTAASSSSDRYLAIEVDALGNLAATDFILLDQVRLYSEKINVDLTLNENWAAITPTVAYLKQDNQVVATAYVDFDDAVSSKSGQIQFVPVSTYGDISVSGSSTFVVEMDTVTAITDNSDATEKLTAKVDKGNVSTIGDIHWYDGAGTVNFYGVNSTDKMSQVTSY